MSDKKQQSRIRIAALKAGVLKLLFEDEFKDMTNTEIAKSLIDLSHMAVDTMWDKDEKICAELDPECGA